ncbi:MAG: hypothetical protein ACYTF7_10065 [Planctomycetota bacterium]|jgi:hypothetical protein
MAKRGAPTLLELSKRYPPTEPSMGRPRAQRVPHKQKPERPAPSPSRDESVDGEGFSLPPSVRIPTGYLFVAAATIVALIMGGYLVGFNRGSANERSARGQEIARDLDSQTVRDPLVRTAPLNPTLLQASPDDGGDQIAATTEPSISEDGGASLTEAIVAIAPDTDPRVPGMNYYIIARDLPDEAVRAATYLRQNGIQASALPTGRPDRKLVVAMEAFASGQTSSQVARDLKASIQEAGRLWKRDHRGTTDFSDCYLARYSN